MEPEPSNNNDISFVDFVLLFLVFIFASCTAAIPGDTETSTLHPAIPSSGSSLDVFTPAGTSPSANQLVMPGNPHAVMCYRQLVVTMNDVMSYAQHAQTGELADFAITIDETFEIWYNCP
jgi:hypothetical protein